MRLSLSAGSVVCVGLVSIVMGTTGCTAPDSTSEPSLIRTPSRAPATDTTANGGAATPAPTSTATVPPMGGLPAAKGLPSCAASFVQQPPTSGSDRYRATIGASNASSCSYSIDDPDGTATTLPSCEYTFDGGPQDFGGPGRHIVYIAANGGGGRGVCSIPLTVPCDASVTPTGNGTATDMFAVNLKSIAGAKRCSFTHDGGAAQQLATCETSAPFTGAALGGAGKHSLAITVEDDKGVVGTCHATFVVN